ncbi:MAG: S24 family peptidase, partial [Deltaproteobacteria bacterium]|nr:S24 family peptidase [Deltaproteobacteria bacterium]
KVPTEIRHLIAPRGGFAKPTSHVARQAPVLGRAACGPWLESYASEPDLFEPVETPDPEAFFVIAEGESMIGGHIPSGSYLLVSPKAGVSNGQIVLARRGEDEFTVKTYYRKADGTIILQPLNSAFEPIILEPGEPHTVMRVTEVRIKL